MTAATDRESYEGIRPALSGTAGVPPASREQLRPRRLLLCLDGVSFELMSAAKQRGLFDKFNSPSRLLSPFPTMTNIALSAMLRASVPLGYETIYFDRAARELRGGIGKYLGRRTADKAPSTYMDQLDYQEPLPFEFLVYVAPEAVWRADMRRFRERFRAAPQDRGYFAFLKGTDGLLHIRGPERLNVALASLDELLREIRAWCGAETEILLFSDHGMNVHQCRRVHLQTHLQRCGFQLARNLHDARRQTVALPVFGLIGFAALYCDEGAAATVAETLVPLEGVDFALYRESAEAIAVKGARGMARIHRQESESGVLYRYELVAGDPLQLGPILSSLRENGFLNEDGYAAAAAWSNQTVAHIYPDALDNLYTSLLTTRVCHPADVLVSLLDGYYFGWSAFEHIVNLVATHGNALRASTNAFLMSTHRTLPEYVRAADANQLLRT
jgi:hypothetical protein